MRASLMVVFFALLASCGPEPTMAERYPGPWGKPTGTVMRTLVANGVRGCGEFYQKKSVKGQEEYAVACTHNPSRQLEWNLYLVWPAIDEVTGPDPLAVYKIGKPPRELTRDDR